MSKRLAVLIAAAIAPALTFAVPAHARTAYPYRLIDLGAFGGPSSFVELHVLHRRAFADRIRIPALRPPFRPAGRPPQRYCAPRTWVRCLRSQPGFTPARRAAFRSCPLTFASTNGSQLWRLA